MLRVSLVLALVAGVGCEKSKAQSFAAGMQLMCDAPTKSEANRVSPAERQQVMSQWIAKRLKNKRARRVFASLAELAPPARRKLLQDSAKEAGIGACALATDAERLPVELERGLAEVPDTHFAELPDGAPRVGVTRRMILVDGNELLEVRNGDVDPMMLGSGSGWKIPSLSKALAVAGSGGTVVKNDTGRTLVIALDGSTPYKLVMRVVMSAVSPPAGIRDFRFLVRAAGKTRAIAITLPNQTPGKARTRMDDGPSDRIDPAAATAQPLGLVLTVGKQVQLWSTSGKEGTLAKPSLTLPVARAPGDWLPTFDETALTRALSGVVDRHWKGENASKLARQLVVMAEKDAPFGTVARAIAAARGPSGKPALFSQILLSPGFQ